MTTTAGTPERDDHAPPSMVPVVLEGGCFGWFHPPVRTAATGRGVVLCPPFGYDAIRTGRGWRVLADMLAAAGLPVLRFDYPGTGDSAGEEEPGRLEEWIASIGAAGAWLRAEAGVRKVALCGFRLGADLAAAAAQRPGTASTLALLAPVGSGRAWRRQLLLAVSGENGGTASSAPACAEWLEVAGFRLHRSDLEVAGRRLDLGSALLAADASRVLVMAPSPLPGPEIRARLRDAGVLVEQRPFDGLGEYLRDAHLSAVPRAAFAALTRWMRDGAPPAGAAPGGRSIPAEPPILRLDGGARESLVRFGALNTLVGVLCEPAPGLGDLAAGTAVLLPNTGANGRIGNGRVAVRLARRLAAAGIASLRMDGTGIGDGGALRDAAADGPPDSYHPQIVRDVLAAVDLLESRGFARVAVAGICSGAHAAFQAAAVGDARISGLVLANLPAFDRDAGFAAPTNGAPPSPSDRHMLQRLRRLARRSARRLAAEADSGAARRLGMELGLDRAGRWMRAVLARRTDVVLAYSERDPGLRELRVHFGRRARRLAGSGEARCVALSGVDHSLLPRAMQEEFIALVEAQILRLRSAPAAEAAAASVPAPRVTGMAGWRRGAVAPSGILPARRAAPLHRRLPFPPPPHHAG
jgi:alpha-beta hydrolase superfamily lysophospholipase